MLSQKLKDKLMQYRFFQLLVKLKMRLKAILQKTRLYERRYDEKSFLDFQKLVEDSDYIYEKEIEILPNILHEGDIAIDIGANRGEYSYYLSKIAGDTGLVFAFEPGKRAFAILEKNKNHFGLNNLQLFNAAVTNKKGNETLIVPFFNRQSQLQTSDPIKGRKETVSTTTLDDFLNEMNVNHVDFIKCDTEGSEYLVFSGGMKSIMKFKPVILVEIADLHSTRFGHSSAEIIDLLKGIDYSPYYYEPYLKKLIKTNKIELKEDSHVWAKKSENLSNNNYLFIHSTRIGEFSNFIKDQEKA